MPEIGEIKRGEELGYKNSRSKHIWLPCADCGKERWVLWYVKKGKPARTYCRYCVIKHISFTRKGKYIGEKHFNWKSGTHRDKKGYVYILTRPDDFFHPMAKVSQRRYIAEHRLVMAKHLGRCLQPFEIVHHKNGIKDDNRIENLELSASRGEHSLSHSKGYRDGYLKGLYDGHENRIKQLEKRVTQLEADNTRLESELNKSIGTIF